MYKGVPRIHGFTSMRQRKAQCIVTDLPLPKTKAILPVIPGHQTALPSSVSIQLVDDSEGNSAVAFLPPCNISEAACWRRISTDTNMFRKDSQTSSRVLVFFRWLKHERSGKQNSHGACLAWRHAHLAYAIFVCCCLGASFKSAVW